MTIPRFLQSLQYYHFRLIYFGHQLCKCVQVAAIVIIIPLRKLPKLKELSWPLFGVVYLIFKLCKVYNSR